MTPGRFTRFTSSTSRLCKQYEETPAGLSKTAAAQMTKGRATVEEFHDVDEVVGLLGSFNHSQALCASLPTPAAYSVAGKGAREFKIVTEAARTSTPLAVARTKQFFQPAAAPGLLILDIDAPTAGPMPPLGTELWSLLLSWAPGLADAGAVAWLSASSEIWKGDQQIRGKGGGRIYLMVADCTDSRRTLDVLNARAWLAGHGDVKVTASGAVRTAPLFDSAMADAGARLDFCPSGAALPQGYEHRRGAPQALCRGGFIDTRRAVPDLSPEEQSKYTALVESAKTRVQPEALLKREEWKAQHQRTAMAEAIAKGEDLEQAKERVSRTLDAALGGTLLGSFELIHVNEHGKETPVSVDAVLADRPRYHLQRFLSPIDHDHRNREASAALYADQPQPCLFDLNDGGVAFKLLKQPFRFIVTPGSRAQTAEAVADQLAQDADLFVVGGTLVRAVAGSFSPVSRPLLQYLIGCRVSLQKQAKDKTIPVDIDEPTVGMVLALLAEHARPVAFRAATPLVCPDGRVVERPGYDADTGGYLDLEPGAEPIPQHPTRAQTVEALRQLWRPWSAYPWATDSDRAAMLATVLTIPLRPTIEAAPGLLADSPLQSSGKSKAVGAVAAIVRGRKGGAKAWVGGDNDAEVEKYLLPVLRAGEPSVNFDNIGHGVFASSVLATTMTEGRLQARVLGFSEHRAPEARVMWLASGVNVALDRDMSTRWLRARIDTKSEAPQLLAYSFDPVDAALSDRLGIVRAAIVVHRAFHAVGRPCADEILTRFSEWGRCVRHLVLWLRASGLAEDAGIGSLGDPAASILEAGHAADPETEALALLLYGLEETFGPDPFTSGDVARAFKAGEGSMDEAKNAVFEGITALMPRARNGLSSQAVGAVLRNRRDRPAANRKLVEVKQFGRDAARGAAWRVEAA